MTEYEIHPIADLIPSADYVVQNLKYQLETHGWGATQNILLDKDGRLLAGKALYEAATAAGYPIPEDRILTLDRKSNETYRNYTHRCLRMCLIAKENWNLDFGMRVVTAWRLIRSDIKITKVAVLRALRVTDKNIRQVQEIWEMSPSTIETVVQWTWLEESFLVVMWKYFRSIRCHRAARAGSKS